MALESANLYYNYYNSESLQSCWRDKDGNDIGFVVVGKVTWETCAYVARYIMKKQKGQGADVYERFNIEPEFCLMSRKPGIAHQYYEDHPEMWDYDKINISIQMEAGLSGHPSILKGCLTLIARIYLVLERRKRMKWQRVLRKLKRN